MVDALRFRSGGNFDRIKTLSRGITSHWVVCKYGFSGSWGVEMASQISRERDGRESPDAAWWKRARRCVSCASVPRHRLMICFTLTDTRGEQINLIDRESGEEFPIIDLALPRQRKNGRHFSTWRWEMIDWLEVIEVNWKMMQGRSKLAYTLIS